MKRPALRAIAGLLGCAVGALALCGCPTLDPATIDPNTFQAPAGAAGAYWVDYTEGELAVYRMPKYRDDPGTWYTLQTEPPKWYAEPALYVVSEDGTWRQGTFGAGQTLDSWLTVWDVGPQPADAEAPAP
jgi:hypothetical protein